MKVWVAQCPNGASAFSRVAPSGPAAQSGQLGRRARFVEEDQPVRRIAHAWLAVHLPFVTRLAHVLALGLRGQQCFF